MPKPLKPDEKEKPMDDKGYVEGGDRVEGTTVHNELEENKRKDMKTRGLDNCKKVAEGPNKSKGLSTEMPGKDVTPMVDNENTGKNNMNTEEGLLHPPFVASVVNSFRTYKPHRCVGVESSNRFELLQTGLDGVDVHENGTPLPRFQGGDTERSMEHEGGDSNVDQ
ncbi:hypothetical protein L6452_42151 [Arctium lappa]|uniref:Uncharacterized protein n=1 Tax=Arctium lappa TaxID=4217 RepID=A0ACB8XHV8_ARCLA|nr:hypothetical protein L6452_42151 [Arctium lappa]